MANKTPLALVKDQFESKDKLVDKLASLLEGDQPKDVLRKTLLPVSNRKLLRLYKIVSTVKEKFGSREKLVAATGDALRVGKDKGHMARIGGFSTPRLLDTVTAAHRRQKRAVAKAEKPAAVKAKKPAVAKAAKAATK